MHERTDPEYNRDAFRVLAVIVLYKMRPRESETYRTFQEAIYCFRNGQNNVSVLLYDNTLGGCDPGPLPEGVRYEVAERNAGVAAAYNRALSIAQSEKYTWLLTLDQDTTLPSDYLSRMSELALQFESSDRVAAIVPG
jgi:GT2 family glycosyltransferase